MTRDIRSLSLLLAAFALLAASGTAQTSPRQTLSTPGLTGSPYPPSAVMNNTSIPVDPRAERLALGRMRVQNYKRMVKDSATLVQLSADLRRQFAATQVSAPGAQAADSDSVAASRKLQKLAGEIDRLMRGQ